jgi:hypothetical protein
MESILNVLNHPPKNAWNAVLTQLLCWSFRRFCVDRLTNDISGATWDSHFSLVADFAPPEFKPHLDAWLAPETLCQVGNLVELDTAFRSLIQNLDKAVDEDDTEAQEAIADFIDTELEKRLERWLGTLYAPYSIFPNQYEPDDRIDLTKLNAVLYLLRKQLVITAMTAARHRRNATHRHGHSASASATASASPSVPHPSTKKTRRRVRFSMEEGKQPSGDTRTSEATGDTGTSEQTGHAEVRHDNKEGQEKGA